MAPPIQGQKIEELLRRKDKTPNWLAQQIGVQRQVVYGWIGGARPRTKMQNAWAKMANILGVEPAVLDDDSVPLPAVEEAVKNVANSALSTPIRAMLEGHRAILPVWRGIVTGELDECYFVDSASPEFTEVPAFLVNHDPLRHIVCVPAGTSMYPRIQQGWRVIVRLDSNPPPNTLVLAEAPDRKRFIKILRAGRPPELHSINDTEFAAIRAISEWTYVGSVIAVWAPPEPGKPNIEFADGLPLRG